MHWGSWIESHWHEDGKLFCPVMNKDRKYGEFPLNWQLVEDEPFEGCPYILEHLLAGAKDRGDRFAMSVGPWGEV